MTGGPEDKTAAAVPGVVYLLSYAGRYIDRGMPFPAWLPHPTLWQLPSSVARSLWHFGSFKCIGGLLRIRECPVVLTFDGREQRRSRNDT